jgi:hypothetical protein
MTLIPNIKQAWKMFSIQAQTINAALLVSWQSLPATFQTILPVQYLIGIAITLLVLGIVGRVIQQDAIKQ